MANGTRPTLLLAALEGDFTDNHARASVEFAKELLPFTCDRKKLTIDAAKLCRFGRQTLIMIPECCGTMRAPTQDSSLYTKATP
jgi:hypothetical protein